MADPVVMLANVVKFPNGSVILTGSATTRATATTQMLAVEGKVGSVYHSSAGKIYLMVTASTSERVTTSAAD